MVFPYGSGLCRVRLPENSSVLNAAEVWQRLPEKVLPILPAYLFIARLAHMMTASAAIWPSTVAVALNLPMSRLWVITSR